jgi:hypothetical protein
MISVLSAAFSTRYATAALRGRAYRESEEETYWNDRFSRFRIAPTVMTT